MNLKLKICLSALLCSCCAALTLLYPLWLIGMLGGLLLLLRYALHALCEAETDPLTGLWNLRRLEHRRRYYEKSPRLAVLYLDLDDLKQINDTLGHSIGNAALHEVAQALLDTDDDVYRIGGDEFLLIVPGEDAPWLESCWHDASESLGISVSWGIAEGPGSDLDDLIIQAEQAMYHNK